MNTKHYITSLILKKIQGTLTQTENSQLNNWLSQADNYKMYLRILEENKIADNLKLAHYCKTRKHKAIKKFKLKLFNHKLISFSKYAAIIGLPLSLSILFLLQTQKKSTTTKVLTENKQIIKPVLILPSGKRKILDQEKFIININNAACIKNNQGTLDFKINSNLKESLGYSEVKTPIGCDYKLSLSDGTKVRLNAGSSLKFPSAFSDSSRIVILEGQAYFDVVKNKKAPFIVKCKQMDIKVLGTRFDVESYKEDKKISTTLLSGSIQANIKGQKPKLIKPNQKLIYNKNKQNIKINKVDASALLSWTKGYFFFIDERLEDVMTKLSRWYGIKVYWNSNESKDIRIGLKYNKDRPLNTILSQLEVVGRIKIKQKDKSIFIKKE